jgi:hypothetical protein
VWREQGSDLIAHSFDYDYLEYLAAKEQLESYLSSRGETIEQQQAYWTWRGMFVLAETESGKFGQFFNDFITAQDQELPYGLDELPVGQVMSESELVQMLKHMQEITEESTPTNLLDNALDDEE